MVLERARAHRYPTAARRAPDAARSAPEQPQASSPRIARSLDLLRRPRRRAPFGRRRRSRSTTRLHRRRCRHVVPVQPRGPQASSAGRRRTPHRRQRPVTRLRSDERGRREGNWRGPPVPRRRPWRATPRSGSQACARRLAAALSSPLGSAGARAGTGASGTHEPAVPGGLRCILVRCEPWRRCPHGGSPCDSARGSDRSPGRVHGRKSLRHTACAPLARVGISSGPFRLLLPRPLHRHRQLSATLRAVPRPDGPDDDAGGRRRARTCVGRDPCCRDLGQPLGAASAVPDCVAHTRPLSSAPQRTGAVRCRRRCGAHRRLEGAPAPHLCRRGVRALQRGPVGPL